MDKLVQIRGQMCPSAQPEMRDARVLGVIGGTADAPMVAYLNEPVAASEEVLALADGARHPADVMRFAARCEESKCCHYDGKNCNLATRIVQILPAVVEALPACLIRAECRWYLQEGRAACLRCPQVVTRNYRPDEDMVRAARVPLGAV
ncbi:MAG: nitrogen fixation protein [Acidobacteria bacterium]|nr:nitrogen fixation protein [Acidobacteriota bacterium]